MTSARSLLLFILLLAGSAAKAQAFDADLLHGLEARAIGPAGMSGRITAIDARSDDPNHLLVGTATGGAWMSDNGGLTWTPVFDDAEVASVGAVAIHPANPDIMWIGTGEGNTRNSTSIGGGLYKSVDGGESWDLVGLENSERINRIALDPDNADVAYVAALGTLWGSNEERGVYKTVDGGKSWSRVLYVDETTGATDIKIDPQNPKKLLAAMWQFRRWPYKFESGGPGSGLYITRDGGETWTELTPEDGLPDGELGRAVFAFAPGDPERVYALVEAEKSALLKSDDGGSSWTAVNTDTGIATRPFYYTELAVDPDNRNRVYNIATRVQVSEDGGRTFSMVEAIDCCAASNSIHIDNHAMWINPADGRHVIVGTDGGLGISRDRTETFRFVRNLPLAQFYHIAVDDALPYNVYGGLQDNGSWVGPSEVWQEGDLRNHHWQEVGFGDGFDVRPFPDNTRAGYSMSQGGNLIRWNLDTGEQRLIRPNPPAPDVTLRFNWDAALAQDPFEAGTIYYGSQFVHKSTDRGETWEVISPDLTTADSEAWEAAKTSGGLTSDVTAAEFFTTITAIAPSPLDRNVIWVGADDGRVHVTRDGGESWTSIEDRARGVEEGAWVPFIEPSPHDAGQAFIVFDDHRRSDMRPYVYRATDYGRRMSRLVDEDDAAGYALSFRQDHVDPDLMFLGTEFGLWVSVDGGEGWTKWTAGVPTVSVMDMAIQQREDDLVLGTHGRSVYVIDDYGALRGLAADDLEQRFALLDTTDGQQYDALPLEDSRFPGSGEFRAPNPAYGAWLTVVASGDDLPHPDPEAERARKAAQRQATTSDPDPDEEADDDTTKPEATVTVSDAAGEVIRTFKAPLKQGVNRIVWDMRRDGVRPMPPTEWKKDTLPAGPEAPPGRYTLTASFDGQEISTDVTLRKDPRAPFGETEIAANHAAQLRLLDMQKTMTAAVGRIYDARRDIDTLLTLAKESEDGDAESLKSLREQAKSLKSALDDLEKRFRTPPDTKGIVYSADKVANILGMAARYVGSTGDAPSQAAEMQMAQASSALKAAVGDLNALLSEDLAALRQAAGDAGLGLLQQAPVDG